MMSTVEECESGLVRLVGGSSNSTGLLEVCANGIWGKICNKHKHWSSANTEVVCKQLGFTANGEDNNQREQRKGFCVL